MKVAVWIIAASLAVIATATVVAPFVFGARSEVVVTSDDVFKAAADHMAAEDDAFKRVADGL